MALHTRLSLSLACTALIGLAGPATAAPPDAEPRPAATKQLAQRFFNLTGVWRGRYWYTGNRPPVRFVARIRDFNGRFRGRIREPNTFGNPSVRFLSAFVRGSHTGRRIRFVKTYDGTGGQRHSVFYRGHIRRSGTLIRGVWRVGGSSGGFVMRRR